METKNLIEALLFISGKPVSVGKLSEILSKDKEEIEKATEQLMEEFNLPERGIHIQKVGKSYQMATSPQATKIIKEFIKSEQTGELTKPSLETLTIIAYRGPITKAELEQIRGVNCSLILRNLLIRGLIEAKDDRKKMSVVYSITFDFLKYLGLERVEQLPEYHRLNSDQNLKNLIETSQKGTLSDSGPANNENNDS